MSSVSSSSSTASNPGSLLTEIYVGGYLLSASQVGRLCVEAWGIPQGRVDYLGPLECAFQYLDNFTSFDSPTLVPVRTHRRSTPEINEIGFILTCSIGFTDIGAPKPNLSLTDEVQAYADRWFPPHIRESPAFRKSVYVQSKHTHRFTPSGVTERKMNEYTPQAQQEHLVRRAKLMEWGKTHGENFPSDSPSIPTKYDYASDKGLREHCCCLFAFEPYDI